MTAQGIEDALRYTQSNGLYTARAHSLGVGYMGIADDFTAVFVNPAGLARLMTSEFSVGLQSRNVGNATTYFNGDNTVSRLGLDIGNIGFAAPIGGRRSRFGFAVGFGTEADFTNADSSAGFNTRSTMINSWVQSANPDLRDLAYSLALADTVRGRLFTPIQDSLYQGQYTIEQGRITNVVGGVGYEVNNEVSIGLSLVGKFGRFQYDRTYIERDAFNVYRRLDRINLSDIDFESLSSQERITQEISGLGIVLGGQYRLENLARLGISIQLPTRYSIQEQFSQTTIARFDNGEELRDAFSGRSQYTIVTPMVVSLGGSVHYEGFTLTAGAKFSDLSQVHFDGGAQELTAVNAQIVRALVPQTQYGVGCEYDGAQSPIAVRVSYSANQSPYTDQTLQSSSTILAGGLGVYVSHNMRFDVSYSRTTGTFQRLMYSGDFSGYRGTQTVTTLMIGAVVRF